MSWDTKGPWRSEPDSYPGILNVVAVDGTRVAGPVILIATDLTTADYRRRTADADLIAAAPEMLEAALMCLDANGHLRGCEAGAGTDGNEDNCTAYCTALRQAVAKAEGREQ